MTKSNNKSRGLLSQTLGLAKKIGETGFELLHHAAPKTVTTLSNQPDQRTVIEGFAEKSGYRQKKYDHPQQMMREHVPQVSRQLFGRHYQRINNVTSFISPQLNDKMSDYFFDKLNDFVSNASSVDHVLKEVGARNLEELKTDVARSERISQALANQNKVLAVLQGSLTGISGVIGAALDVPTSLALALRMVYQTGRAHGFELEKNEEQDVVQYIFKQIDLGSVAEKQALLVAVRTLSQVLQNHNVQQLQQFLGSDNSADPLKKWLSNEDGSLKWSWVDKLPQMTFLNKLTPLAGVGISAVYSWKLVEDANEKAIAIFSEARRYLILHPEKQLSALVAYEKSEILLAKASPILLADFEATESQPVKSVETEQNEVITEVQVMSKQDAQDVKKEVKTLQDLAEEHGVAEEKIEDITETTQVQEPENTVLEAESAGLEKQVQNEKNEQCAQNPGNKNEHIQVSGDLVDQQENEVESVNQAKTEVLEGSEVTKEEKQPELKRTKKPS